MRDVWRLFHALWFFDRPAGKPIVISFVFQIFAGGLEVGHLWAKLLDGKNPSNVLPKEGSVIPGERWRKIGVPLKGRAKIT